MKWIFLPIAASLLMSTVARAQQGDYPVKLADWYASEPPSVLDDQYWVAQGDFKRNWVVKLDGGKPVVALESLQKPPSPLPFPVDTEANNFQFAGSQLATPVTNGWIASFNKGEFGGSVWWFSTDGKEHYRISEENIEAFVPTTLGLFMLEGLAHGNADEGSLRRLVQGRDGRWSSELFVDLGDPPFAATKEADGTLMVVTNQRLFKIDLASKRADRLVDHAFWQSLYPNSIVIDPMGQVWVGMRHGVAQLSHLGPVPKTKWLLPSKAVADEKFVPGLR